MLRYLLLSSTDVRASFLKLLSDASPVGNLSAEYSFGCHLEVATKHDKGTGRVDLLIETDTVLFGIENKLGAGFQDDQLQKYFPTLDEKAKALGVLRGIPSVLGFLVVLAPEARRGEVENYLKDARQAYMDSNGFSVARYAFLSWNQILSAFRDLIPQVDSRTAFLISEFHSYLVDSIEFLPNFSEWITSLKNGKSEPSMEHQRKLLSALTKVVPNYRSAIRTQKDDWNGFVINLNKSYLGLIGRGYLSAEGLPRELNQRELVVVAKTPDTELGPAWVSCKYSADWARPLKLSSWIIDFDETWTTKEKWEDVLSPVLK